MSAIISALLLASLQSQVRAEPLGKLSRTITLKAATPKEGIRSGVVIAYGHVLSKPYLVEEAGAVLYINGIQVSPSLVLQQHVDNYERTKKSQPASIDLEKLTLKARTIYTSQLRTKTVEEVKAIVRDIVLQERGVADASWRTDTFLAIRPTGASPGSYPLGIVIPAAWRKSGPSSSQKVGRATQIQNLLVSGKCVFFLSEGGMWQGADPRKAVNEIMKSASDSAAKSNELRRVFGGAQGPALDVRANYLAAEWRNDEAD